MGCFVLTDELTILVISLYLLALPSAQLAQTQTTIVSSGE
jgi:hypothetical protein